jgi:catechol 2,3-dioxygenase-like lactoylglutathione lyase family enzyme
VRTPVTADDVLASVAAAVSALRPGGDWSARAGELEWTCWETVEHIADDLVFYAMQLGVPTYAGYLPLESTARYPGGEPNAIRSDPAAGAEGLLAVLTASAALLAAMVLVTPREVRAHHTFGPADPEASAAMGVIETVVHTADVARGLGVDYQPDPALCERVLARLFPDVEETAEPWETLRWATGRIALPGRPRRVDWRWSNAAPVLPSRHRAAAGLGLVTLVVPDYDVAIGFYVGAAGFSLVEDTALGDGKRWVVVAPATGMGAALLLARAEGDSQAARVGDQTGGRVAFFLTTADIAADYARMRAGGVLFAEEPRDEPYGAVAVFVDPFGNRWDLIEPH